MLRLTRLEKRDAILNAVSTVYHLMKISRKEGVISDQEFVLVAFHLKRIEKAVKLPCAECLTYPMEVDDGPT